MFSWLTGGEKDTAKNGGANQKQEFHQPGSPSHIGEITGCGTGGGPGQIPAGAIHLLVIQEDAYDWVKIVGEALRQKPFGANHDLFYLETLNNNDANDAHAPSSFGPRALRVVQTSWKDIHVGPCTNQVDRRPKPGRATLPPKTDGNCSVTVAKKWVNGKPVDGRPITFTPDFVLIRNEVVTPRENYKQQLLGLMFANIPSINSLKSIYLFCDKPVVQGALHNIRSMKFPGEEDEKFPLIPQDFFPTAQGFFYGHQFPAVVKFGTAHAGYGKLKIHHHHDMDDVRGLMELTKDKYATGEPFIHGKKDLRVQKIGNHFRAFERVSVNGSWKTNTGTAILTEVPVTDEYRDWALAAAEMFSCGATPGSADYLDILTVDAIVEDDGENDEKEKVNANAVVDNVQQQPTPAATATPPKKEKKYILEVNGTSSGLGPDVGKEDNGFIAELVLSRLYELFPQN